MQFNELLHIPPNDSEKRVLLYFGISQLFPQYIVDVYVKIEMERLLFLKLNQTTLRFEEYIYLRDAAVNEGNATNIEKLIILPENSDQCATRK
ncbi:helitron_like_N domain-containing protein [Trichonephila clavipes]|nr:helitron_like_N domain-containing protein [Trichonephila clavipes]